MVSVVAVVENGIVSNSFERSKSVTLSRYETIYHAEGHMHSVMVLALCKTAEISALSTVNFPFCYYIQTIIWY